MVDRDYQAFMKDPFGGKGTLIADSPWSRSWISEDEQGKLVTCDVSYTGPILDANKQQLNSSAGKRWGDGQVVARIPLDMYFKDFNKARKNGDTQWVKRFLNDSDNSKLRTFEGKL